MPRALRVLGYILIIAASGVVLIGSVGVLIFQGFWEFVWLFSPYNWANFLMILIALTPGALCLWGAKKLEGKKEIE